MRRPEFIARQSRCPSGLLGRVIGHVMSRETAAANDAALKLLGVGPGDQVLEVGFGHGRTIELAAALVGNGTVSGIDTSEEMVRMAERRCRHLVAEGRVELILGDAASMPYPDRRFDKAYAIHTIYFWNDPPRYLRELRRVLREGGKLLLGFRPAEDRASADFPESVYSFRTIPEVCAAFDAAGFEDMRVEQAGAGLRPRGLILRMTVHTPGLRHSGRRGLTSGLAIRK